MDRCVSIVTGLSRSDSAGLVSAGSVRLGGRVVRSRSRRVSPGELLEIQAGEGGLLGGDVVGTPPPADASIDLAIAYEDADAVVVDKPAGLVVHPGAGQVDATLVNGLLARYPEISLLATGPNLKRPGIVHRLDKGTSGLLVVARTPEGHESLSAQMAARRVERRYSAVVVGHVDSDEGLIDARLGRSPRDPTRMAVVVGGRQARTRYRVEARFDAPVAATLLEVVLDTGRTHQIRAHMSAIGHPLAGDEHYGWRPRGGDPAGSLPEGRVWLHARFLGFDQPRSGQRLRCTSPLPAELVADLEARS